MLEWTDDKRWEDGWESLEDLPAGGQGAVKKVKCHLTGQIAFLKVLSRQNDSERRSRFFREATAYNTCNHANMPRLFQSNAHLHNSKHHKLFLVTELIEGPTLTNYIEMHGPVDFDRATKGMMCLLGVVEYCHNEDWVHRDIKPDNIVLRAGSVEDPVLVDFGLGYKDGLTSGFQTEHGQEIGNRFFRLTELSAGSPLKQDVRSDLSFLGGIFFYMLTGIAPFSQTDGEGRLPHQRSGVPNTLRDSAGRAISPLLSFFDRAFSSKLSGRHDSAAQMKSSLLDIINEYNNMSPISPSDEWDTILTSLNSQSNQQLIRLKGLYDLAMASIKSVHSEIADKVGPTFVSYQTGYLDFTDGLRNVLGFSHFATHDHRFSPMFEIKQIGEEIVVYMDGVVVHRTDIDTPTFDQTFRERISNIFQTGLKELALRPIK
jgi:serine/threonine protein kinase